MSGRCIGWLMAKDGSPSVLIAVTDRDCLYLYDRQRLHKDLEKSNWVAWMWPPDRLDFEAIQLVGYYEDAGYRLDAGPVESHLGATVDDDGLDAWRERTFVPLVDALGGRDVFWLPSFAGYPVTIGTSPPPRAAVGEIWVDTSSSKTVAWDGSGWVPMVPMGDDAK